MTGYYTSYPGTSGSAALAAYGDAHLYQHYQQALPQVPSITEQISSNAAHAPQSQPTRSTLRLDGLEPWMDVEYFNQVCGMMRWENVILKIPHAPVTEYAAGKAISPNNPGYCFLTFPVAAKATTVLAQFSPPNPPTTMPNSKRPFSVTWATVPASSARSSGPLADADTAGGLFAPGNLSLLNPFTSPPADDAQQSSGTANNRQPEFSIFVGDLAPETTNSDLIAVFRDPILGLKHDREPKFVAPFTSCRSAKIMVDAVMGVSKGYGFVRFGSASDAARALIEMQGLYCLSRPSKLLAVGVHHTLIFDVVRISQATAKARTSGFPANLGSHAVGASAQFDHDYIANGSDLTQGLSVTSPMAGGPVAGFSSHRDGGSPTNSVSSSGSASAGKIPSKIAAEAVARHLGDCDPLDALPADTLTALSKLNVDKDVLNQLLKMATRSESEKPAAMENKPMLAAIPGQDEMQAHRTSFSSVQNASRTYSQSISGTSATSGPAAARTVTTPVSGGQRAQSRSAAPNVTGSGSGVLNSADPYNTTVRIFSRLCRIALTRVSRSSLEGCLASSLKKLCERSLGPSVKSITSVDFC